MTIMDSCLSVSRLFFRACQMQFLSRPQPEHDGTETIVCHCLQVSESAVADAIAVCGLASVREVCRETGAGGGCTACHARLKEMLQHTRQSVRVC